MIHGVGVGGTRRLKIGPVTSPTSPEALAPTPQKEHRPQSEPSHLLSLSWEHPEVAPITPCSSRDRAGLCSPATLSGMWPDGPRCACHTRGPASVCTRRLQTGHHSSFQSQCPHAPHTTAETASNWTCAFMTHGPFPPISTPSRQPRSFQPTAASLPITRSVLWVQDTSRPAPLPDCFPKNELGSLPPPPTPTPAAMWPHSSKSKFTMPTPAPKPLPTSTRARMAAALAPPPLGPREPHSALPSFSSPSPLAPSTRGGLYGSSLTWLRRFATQRDEACHTPAFIYIYT